MDVSPEPPSVPLTPIALQLDDVEVLDSVLSVGVFGELREAVWMGAPCAARKLQEDQMGEEQMKNCLLWNSLNHPNIVTLLGVSTSPFRLHWVLTELITVHLADLLKSSPRSLLPLPFKLSILQDVACAVRFLHSMTPRPLLHGDLQAEHVFLTPSVRAKLDLWDVFFASNQGMRKEISKGILNADLEATFHLAPEVMTDGFAANLSGKLGSDAFSFGVLCLHVLVHMLPTPKESMIVVSADKAICFSEVDRRSEHINALQGKEKLFLPIITQCLKGTASNRPSMTELCDRLRQLQAQIAVGKLGKSILNGGTVVDIGNHLQHISESAGTTGYELKAFQSQLRSLLGLAEDAVVPVPNTPTLPRKTMKKAFDDVTYPPAVERLRSLPAHYRHTGPTFASPEPEIDEEVDSPVKVRLYACMWVLN